MENWLLAVIAAFDALRARGSCTSPTTSRLTVEVICKIRRSRRSACENEQVIEHQTRIKEIGAVDISYACLVVD